MSELLAATSHLIPGCGQMVSERSELIGLWSGTEKRPAREAAVGWPFNPCPWSLNRFSGAGPGEPLVSADQY